MDFVPVLLALGSNMGNRMAHLAAGVRALEGTSGLRVVRASSVYESRAQGVSEGEADFLNAVLLGETRLSPRTVLERALEVEEKAGRERGLRGAPRTLDVDLIFHGRTDLEEEGLVVPHPRWRERSFVLAPLAEVAPRFRDPGSGSTVLQVWRELRSRLPPARPVAPPAAIFRPTPSSVDPRSP